MMGSNRAWWRLWHIGGLRLPGHRQFLLGEDKSWEGEGGRAGLVEKRRLSQKFPASFCLTFMSEKCHRATLAARKTGKVNFWLPAPGRESKRANR